MIFSFYALMPCGTYLNLDIWPAQHDSNVRDRL